MRKDAITITAVNLKIDKANFLINKNSLKTRLPKEFIIPEISGEADLVW